MCITVRGPGCPGFLERPREMRSGLLPRLGPSRVESWRALSGGDQRVRVEHLGRLGEELGQRGGANICAWRPKDKTGQRRRIDDATRARPCSLASTRSGGRAV